MSVVNIAKRFNKKKILVSKNLATNRCANILEKRTNERRIVPALETRLKDQDGLLATVLVGQS